VFIEVDPNETFISNRLPDWSLLSARQPTIANRPAHSSTVFMAGHTSGWIQLGLVTNTHYNNVLYGVFFTNLTETNVISRGGDSGGTIFHSVLGQLEVAGIVMASTNQGPRRMIFSKSDLIHGAFAFMRY